MPAYPHNIGSFVEEQYPFLISILQTDNPPGEEDRMRQLLSREIKALGGDIRIDDAGNLLGFLGEGPAFLLGGHMDSVMPCKGVKVMRDGDIVHSDGTTVLCADDGVGIFEIFVAIRFLQQEGIPHCAIDLLFTVGEEIGGVGVQALDIESLRARMGILMDRAGPPGSFVIAGPYKRNFRVTFHGVAAHALEAEKGASAIHMAAACIAQFPQGKIHDGLYANIGKIAGGDAVNQVAEWAILEGEVRAFSPLDAKHLLEEYDRIIKSILYRFGASGTFSPTAEFEYTSRREGYRHDPGIPLIKILCSLHEQLGIKTSMQITRGCSDAGDLTNKGIVCLNYGNGAQRVHTKEERVHMDDVKTVVWVLVNLLQQMEQNPKILLTV